MSTHTKDPEEVAALEYLRARAAKEGINGMTLSMTSDVDSECIFWARAPVCKNSARAEYGFGKTIADAIAELRTKLSASLSKSK